MYFTKLYPLYLVNMYMYLIFLGHNHSFFITLAHSCTEITPYYIFSASPSHNLASSLLPDSEIPPKFFPDFSRL